MNIANWLYSKGRTAPDSPALFNGDRLYATYYEYARAACAVGDYFQRRYSIQPGDRVALFAKNRVEYLILMYATWWIGAVVVPINSRLHASEAGWILDNADASLLCTDDGTMNQDMSLPSGCQEVGIDTAELLAVLADASARLTAPFSMKDESLAWLFYTSGTTGRPKGVMLSHANLIAMSLCYALDVDDVSPDDAAVYAAPLSHGAGLYNFVHVRSGARHVVPRSRGFDSAEILDLAQKLGNVSMFAAPTMVKRLIGQARHDGVGGDGIKTIICGGAPMYAADFSDAIDALGPRFAHIYGQGESPMTITAIRRELIADQGHERWQTRVASVGTAQSCVEVRVVDESLRDMPVGDAGQIIVRGSTVMAGYWRNPDATRATIIDGWLQTGDIGYFDEEGYLTLTDRLKDMIISGGSNIYPREVEEVLAAHPGVFEVAVIGAPHSDWGEQVVAFVVPHNGVRVETSQLDDWCKDHIAAYKRPRQYRICEELPKNSYGKILKTALREQFARASSAHPQ